MAVLRSNITLSGVTCIIPESPGRANSYTNPAGPKPGRAFVLMLKSDIDTISANATHTLVFNSDIDGVEANLTVAELHWVKATRVHKGGIDDPDALFMVELADKRLIAQQMSDTDEKNYNIRSYANTADYLTGTAVASWKALIDDLWGELPSGFGAAPAIVDPLAGAPEDFRFSGVNAWQAVHEVLARVSNTSILNPDGTFTFVKLGSAQTLPTTLPTPEWNAEPVEHDSTKIAETVRVYFHQNHKSYGQERDTELATNWSITSAYHSVDVATSVSDAVSGSVVQIWDDLAFLLDENNSNSNGAAITTRAAEVAANYVADRQTARAHKVFTGIQPTLLPGSQVKVVQHKAGGKESDARGIAGTVTSYVSHPGVPAILSDDLESCCFSPVNENIAAADLGRKTFPNYPRIANIVQVDKSGASAGDSVTANASGLHEGKVSRFIAGAIATLDACWILFVDDYDNVTGQVIATNKDYYGPARLSGLETVSATQLPVYVCRKGSESSTPIRFRLTATLSLTGSAAAVILNCDASDGAAITVNDYSTAPGMFSGPSGYIGWAYRTDCGDYAIINMERKARFIEFTLTADIAAGSATATINDSWDGQSPGASTTVFDPQDLHATAISGDKGKAAWDDIEDRYKIIEMKSASLDATELCVTEAHTGYTRTTAAALNSIDELQVNKAGALRLWSEDADAKSFLLDIGANLTNSVYAQTAADVVPQFTECPVVQKQVTIGQSGVQRGWLTLHPEESAKSFNMAAGAASLQSWLMPETDPAEGGFLTANKVSVLGGGSPTCIQLQWAIPGKTGTVTLQAGYSIIVDCGKVTSIKDDMSVELLSACTTSGDTPTCTIDSCSPYDPCS